MQIIYNANYLSIRTKQCKIVKHAKHYDTKKTKLKQKLTYSKNAETKLIKRKVLLI